MKTLEMLGDAAAGALFSQGLDLFPSQEQAARTDRMEGISLALVKPERFPFNNVVKPDSPDRNIRKIHQHISAGF